MDLKYISKNDGYIIDRKFTNPSDIEGERTYKESGRMIFKEIIPVGNENTEKELTEYAFDSMKDNVLETIKKKYSVSNEGIYNFYFEGNIEKDSKNKMYAKFQNEEIPVTLTNFNLDYEVEVKVTSRNFIKVQYHNLMYRINSI